VNLPEITWLTSCSIKLEDTGLFISKERFIMKHTPRAIFVLSMFVMVSVFSAWQFFINEDPPSLLRQESPYSLAETIKNVKHTVTARNFHMIREQPVAEGFLSGEDKKQHIVYFCNFTEAYQSLQKNKQIGYMLPCRFTISEEDGKVFISALNPAAINKLTGEKVGAACITNGDGFLDIMEEAVL
jgi:cytochrome c oxidase cbb3-type subunit 3